tara:strand:+ start:489 stop:1301 length:813 start_codon:yes stop_codon:yes gene_type:complete
MQNERKSGGASNRKLVSYLTTVGATLGSASASAAILHLDPDPDLVAIDADVFAAGSREQITVTYGWDEIEDPGKGGGMTPGNFNITATVDSAESPAQPNQVVFRPDDFARTRVAESSIGFGTDVRIAVGPRPPGKGEDSSQAVNNAIFTTGDMIDASSDWADDVDSKGNVAVQPVPTDGFDLFLGVRLTSGLVTGGKQGELSDVSNFGWIRYSLHDSQAVLHDLALELEPGTGIVAGAVPLPGSLPLLVSGAAGLAAYRARRRAGVKQKS